jgi:glutathione S-transferase
MKLYYSPGACSLASHIVLCELGVAFRRVAVSLKRKTTADGEDFLAVNPKGYVPALGLDEGGVLTEGPAILQYLADLRPELGLAPANGTMARYRLQEWLGFINSELHNAFGPLFDPTAPDESRERARSALARRFTWVAGQLAGPYLMGAAFTVADAYLYTVLTWTRHVGPPLETWPALEDYLARIGQRESVRAAHEAEHARPR